MKKKFLLLGFCVIISNVFGQDAADKKVQAGLIAGIGLNFQKMGTKLMTTNGVGSDMTIGANVNFSFNETIGLNTGVEFDFESLKYQATETPVYYYYLDNDILSHEDAGTTGSQLYELTNRKQKPVYLTVPTMLIFRTNFIGYFRYFGKFGLRNSFLLKNSIHDNGANYNPDNLVTGTRTTEKNNNMSAKNEMWFFKSAVGVSGGAEWNFTGSTCLIAEIGYYYGFTPLHANKKDDKSYYFTSGLNNGSGNDILFSNAATQSQLQIKLSILF